MPFSPDATEPRRRRRRADSSSPPNGWCTFMTTRTETEDRSAALDRGAGVDMVVGFAVLGCLVAGAVGIGRALNMDSGLDVLLCLLGSVAAFGVVLFTYLRKG